MICIQARRIFFLVCVLTLLSASVLSAKPKKKTFFEWVCEVARVLCGQEPEIKSTSPSASGYHASPFFIMPVAPVYSMCDLIKPYAFSPGMRSATGGYTLSVASTQNPLFFSAVRLTGDRKLSSTQLGWLIRYTGKGTLRLFDMAANTSVPLINAPVNCSSPVALDDDTIAVVVEENDRKARLCLYSLKTGITKDITLAAGLSPSMYIYRIIGRCNDDPNRLLVIFGDDNSKEKTLLRIVDVTDGSVAEVSMDEVELTDLQPDIPPAENSAVSKILHGSRLYTRYGITHALNYDEIGIYKNFVLDDGTEYCQTYIVKSHPATLAPIDNNDSSYLQSPYWLTFTKILYIEEGGIPEIGPGLSQDTGGRQSTLEFALPGG